jgi:threonine aldolase
MLGGAMRQAGIVAAAGLYALDHHVERLATDHEHARMLAEALDGLPGVELDARAVETNIVICSVPDARALATALERRGVLVGALDARRLRMVTHLDVDRAGVERAIDALRATLRR